MQMMNKNGENEIDADSRSRKQGWLQLALVVSFIGGAFLFSLYLAGLQTTPGPERETELREILVETARVAPRSYRLRFAATGTVQVRALTNIVPQVSGRVENIDDSAFPGGLFTPETILFEIEKSDFRLEVERLAAEVTRAEAQLEQQQASAEAAVAEWRQLNPDEPVPPLVAQKPELQEAKAALQAARASLRAAELNLARTEFQLPFSGRIIEFQLEQGQYAVAGQSYGQAYRIASLEIDVPLEKQQLAWLLEAKNPSITIRSGNPDPHEYRGYVKRVAGKVDPQTRFTRAVLGIRETRPDLVPDMFVTVYVIGPERKNVWVLPLNALQENGQIWLVSPENTLTSLKPEIIQITENRLVAKSNGDVIQVVRGNLPEATEGTPVRLADDREEQEPSNGFQR